MNTGQQRWKENGKTRLTSSLYLPATIPFPLHGHEPIQQKKPHGSLYVVSRARKRRAAQTSFDLCQIYLSISVYATHPVSHTYLRFRFKLGHLNKATRVRGGEAGKATLSSGRWALPCRPAPEILNNLHKFFFCIGKRSVSPPTSHNFTLENCANHLPQVAKPFTSPPYPGYKWFLNVVLSFQIKINLVNTF